MLCFIRTFLNKSGVKELVSLPSVQTGSRMHRNSTRHFSSRTIFALSSGSGKSGVAVVRASGPRSKYALEQLCGAVTKPRVATLRTLKNPYMNDVLDRAIVLWFPGPKSFTGEDCAEFHIHGGPAVISSVLAALGSVPGLTPAQAGDFAKQAFLNGKIDLIGVEGLGDLIHAETQAQRRQALRQMDGDLSKLYSSWRNKLIKCLANTEAFIDFHEEENIEEDILETVEDKVSSIAKEVGNHLNDCRRGERLRDGLHVAIVGEPNVGKSSLLNAICRRPAAIVSPIAGTTRDIVESALDIGGYPIFLSDTAGLRETTDVIEKEGVRRAIDRAQTADLIILVIDVSRMEEFQRSNTFMDFVNLRLDELGLSPSLDENENATKPLSTPSAILSSSSETADNGNLFPLDSSNVIIVFNKSDKLTDFGGDVTSIFETESDQVCCLSCLTGKGMDDFMQLLIANIKRLCGDPRIGNPSLTQTRHRHHLTKCVSALKEFSPLAHTDVVLAAECLRQATKELGQVTGIVSAEDVLDVIFKDFCIGK